MASQTSGTSLGNIIPMPESVIPSNDSFALVAGAKIYVRPGATEITSIGQYLVDKLNPSTGYNLQIVTSAGAPTKGSIYLTTVGGDPSLGEEGYVLTITRDLVSVLAFQPVGLFRGIQTIRQLLPPSIERSTVQPGPWVMATGMIRDHPRFVWRGTMLDVARHFFSAQDVKRYIDLVAYYKMNRFHLHLTDDQGWRIVINSWPNLAAYGGSTKVGGGPGGYFTQADYSDIVEYAQRRYITVIPEIDMPGHTNAALASYAILNCNGIAPPLYTGIGVGFSALCVGKDATYAFVEDAVREISALTPGPYIHIGGDEASAMSSADYVRFVERVQSIVQSYGKQMIGWEEIAQCRLLSTSIAQHWYSNLVQGAIQQSAKVIMSPATRTYLDMKYNPSTTLGQNWAGYIEVQDAYAWDPATQVAGVPESDVLGVEAPLWTETIQSMADIEQMAFPRLAGYAEIGWSPATGRNWDEYKVRLGTHGPRLTAMGVNFYRSSQVPWK
jgi:hexosaminidase